jgi:Flp pilus assembly CpaF family ATPase
MPEDNATLRVMSPKKESDLPLFEDAVENDLYRLVTRAKMPATAGRMQDEQVYLNQMRANAVLLNYLRKNQNQIIDRIRRKLGQAAPLLDDDITTDIGCNPDGRIFAKKLFEDELDTGLIQKYENAMSMCQIVAMSGGLSFTFEEPHLEYVVPFVGARFTASMMPLVNGVMWRIRKRIAPIQTLDDYLNALMISRSNYDLLIRAIYDNSNILIVAPQGAGKSTFASAVLNSVAKIYPNTRFAILEDTPEILCMGQNKYEMLTAPRLGWTFGRLVPVQLRYTAKSLTIGEIRADVAAWLELLGTGTERTGVATIHGHSEDDACRRIEAIGRKENTPISGHEIRNARIVFVVMKKSDQGKPMVSKVTWITDVVGSDYKFAEPQIRRRRRDVA